MVYQLATFQGDLPVLNALLQDMQLKQSCEIIEVLMTSDNNYLIKFREPNTSIPWYAKLFQ